VRIQACLDASGFEAEIRTNLQVWRKRLKSSPDFCTLLFK
jgi:hypothetical protein